MLRLEPARGLSRRERCARRLHGAHGVTGQPRLGLLALARKYTPERLEGAGTRRLAIRATTLSSVTNILKCGLDRQPALFPEASAPVIDHENVRGPGACH